MLAAIRHVGRSLTAQRDAALLDQYNGPVLFEGQAAAEIFSQVFAPQLSGRPRVRNVVEVGRLPVGRVVRATKGRSRKRLQ